MRSILEAIKEADKYKIDKSIILLMENKIPKVLIHECEVPTIFFELYDNSSKEIPRILDLIPLWESNGERVITFDKKNNVYLEYYFGDSNDEFTFWGKNFQQLMCFFFVELLEADINDSKLKAIEKYFNFKYLDELIRVAEESNDDEWEDKLNEFIATIK